MKRKEFRKLMGVVLAALLLAAAAGPLFGENKVYYLTAGAIPRTMPDGKTVTLWGYAVTQFGIEGGVLEGDVNAEVTVPGPLLAVAPGQGLKLYLYNALPAPTGGGPAPSVSILIPGQPLPLKGDGLPTAGTRVNGRIRSFVHETAPNTEEVYYWPSIAPGTYLYHSGSHPAVQVQMGLYGALTANAVDAVPDPTTPIKAQAYPGAAFEYDQELVFLYSEIDPALHEAVVGAPDPDDPLGIAKLTPTYGTDAYPSTINYNPKYFLVNGQVEDDTDLTADVTTAGSATLLRFLNASLWDHVPQFLGTYVKLIAEDGKPYTYSKQQYSLLLPAGKTLDAVLMPEAGSKYQIFDRRLFRSQVLLPAVQGSMHALIRTAP